MQISHVADDFAAIARRLKELQEENRRLEDRAAQPFRRANGSYQLDRPSPGSLRSPPSAAMRERDPVALAAGG